MSREAYLRAYFNGEMPGILTLKAIGMLSFASLFLLIGLTTFTGSGSCSNGCAMFFLAPGAVLGLVALHRFWVARASARRRLLEMAAGPEDADVQALIDQSLEGVKSEALESLGLTDEDLESDLLTVVAPSFDATSEVEAESSFLFRKGDDGELRFSAYQIAVIALTDHRLGLFSCDYDLLSDRALNARTFEYHYTDIVSVSTGAESKSLQFPSGETLSSIQEFRVSVPNGEAIRIVVDSAEIRRVTGEGSLPSSGAEKAVRAIRAQLRRKEPA